RERISRVSVPVAVFCLSLAASAWGHGFIRGDFARRGGAGGRGPRGGGVVLQLIFPCRAGCFDADRTCDEMAEAAAVTCGEASCDTQIQAARAACQADATSDDCDTARTALVTCLQPCLDTERAAVTACRTTLDSCVTTCGTS